VLAAAGARRRRGRNDRVRSAVIVMIDEMARRVGEAERKRTRGLYRDRKQPVLCARAWAWAAFFPMILPCLVALAE
jgi:hypothetical protein